MLVINFVANYIQTEINYLHIKILIQWALVETQFCIRDCIIAYMYISQHICVTSKYLQSQYKWSGIAF